jgi:hypothetical protein
VTANKGKTDASAKASAAVKAAKDKAKAAADVSVLRCFVLGGFEGLFG